MEDVATLSHVSGEFSLDLSAFRAQFVDRRPSGPWMEACEALSDLRVLDGAELR